MDARTALEEYKRKGERVDEVLFSIINDEIIQLREALQKSEKKCNHLSTSLHHVKNQRDDARVKLNDQRLYANRLKYSLKELRRQLNYAERQLYKKGSFKK